MHMTKWVIFVKAVKQFMKYTNEVWAWLFIRHGIHQILFFLLLGVDVISVKLPAMGLDVYYHSPHTKDKCL